MSDPVTVAFDPPEITELDLAAEGISSVIWTSGYRLDFGWIDLPVFGDDGWPREYRGVAHTAAWTSASGLPSAVRSPAMTTRSGSRSTISDRV